MFQRTPVTAIPMRQRRLDPDEQALLAAADRLDPALVAASSLWQVEPGSVRLGEGSGA